MKGKNIFKIGLVILIAFAISGINFTPSAVIQEPGGEDTNQDYWALFIVPHISWRGTYKRLSQSLIENGWEAEHIQILDAEEATRENIKIKFQELDENESYLDTTLIYIGAHGTSDNFEVWDSYYVDYTEINENLSNLESAGIAVIIDACKSGGAINYLKQDGRIIVTASKSNENITCGGGIGNYMAEGFNQFGDYFEGNETIPPGNRDGVASMEEAFNFSICEGYGSEKKHGQMKLQHWGELSRKIREIVMSYKELPINLVVICQENIEKDGDDVIAVTPMLSGKSKTFITYSFDVVGYAGTRKKET